MDRIFQRIIDNDLSDLKGLIVDASVPVPQYLVNEIIEAALRGNTNIDSCEASIHEQNRVSVDLKTPRWPWPLNLKLRLYRSVDFTNSPKVRATLENNVLLGKLGSFFKALPDGIRINGDQIVVDLGHFLRTPEQRRILDLVRSVEIRTEEGRFIFDVTARI
ncbi:MAG TPA: hypothetical protein VMN99_14505 [Anaerolineales bacterium]|nr:hypothetical protein [Anaerolineales bacterium]